VIDPGVLHHAVDGEEARAETLETTSGEAKVHGGKRRDGMSCRLPVEQLLRVGAYPQAGPRAREEGHDVMNIRWKFLGSWVGFVFR